MVARISVISELEIPMNKGLFNFFLFMPSLATVSNYYMAKKFQKKNMEFCCSTHVAL